MKEQKGTIEDKGYGTCETCWWGIDEYVPFVNEIKSS